MNTNFCNTCNAIGGYCGQCDGSHWQEPKQMKRVPVSTAVSAFSLIVINDVGETIEAPYKIIEKTSEYVLAQFQDRTPTKFKPTEMVFIV